MSTQSFFSQPPTSDPHNDEDSELLTSAIPGIDNFLQHCQKRRFYARSNIIFAGKNRENLYFLIKGTVTVVLEDDECREIVIAYLNEYDFFGELGLFNTINTTDKNYSVWVKAKTNCEVAEISYSKCMGLWQVYPEVFFHITSQIAKRLKLSTSKAGDLAFMDIAGRVAKCLTELCAQSDAITHPKGMQIKVTRKEISLIVGCSREMVGRVIKDMQAQGLIEVHGKTMVILGTR